MVVTVARPVMRQRATATHRIYGRDFSHCVKSKKLAERLWEPDVISFWMSHGTINSVQGHFLHSFRVEFIIHQRKAVMQKHDMDLFEGDVAKHDQPELWMTEYGIYHLHSAALCKWCWGWESGNISLESFSLEKHRCFSDDKWYKKLLSEEGSIQQPFLHTDVVWPGFCSHIMNWQWGMVSSMGHPYARDLHVTWWHQHLPAAGYAQCPAGAPNEWWSFRWIIVRQDLWDKKQPAHKRKCIEMRKV